jgi:hypothetical protein
MAVTKIKLCRWCGTKGTNHHKDCPAAGSDWQATMATYTTNPAQLQLGRRTVPATHVTCTHCSNGFVVNLRKWRGDARGYLTRACPYCFKCSMVPKQL